MKDSFRSVLYLLAPCAALGVFAIFLARRPTPPPTVPLYGPLQFSVQGVETQQTLPLNVSEGYDHRFHLVLQASGKRPKWWGQSINSKSGNSSSGWKFWLERGGKRRPFVPRPSIFWTTDWDKDKKHYFNEFLLHCGEVPADATLKASGITHASIPGSGAFSSVALPFEVTLKKAGQAWTRPQVSTTPHLLIRKIEIQRLKNGQTVGLVTVFAPPGADFDHASMQMPQMLTGDWHPYAGTTYNCGLGFSSGNNFGRKSPSNRVQTFTFQWATADVGRAWQRDIIVTERYSVANSWPLEIAFAIKKDGKSVFGVVPALTRPTSQGIN